MPYFRNPLIDEQELENGEQSQVQIGGGGDAATGPAESDSGNQPKNSPTGSNFQNLDKYLSVNPAKEFSTELQGKIQGDIQKGRDQTRQTFQNLNTEVASYKAPDKSAVTAAVANPVAANPTDYQGWINQTYKGPMSLESNQNASNTVRGAVQGATDKAGLAATTPGRFTLLDSYFGKPQYSMGQKSLDNLLVRKGGGLNASALKGSANSLAQSTKVNERDLQNAAGVKVGEIEQGRKFARSTLGIDDAGNLTGQGALGEFDKGLAERAALKNQQAQADYDGLVDRYQRNALTDADLQSLGLRRGQRLYGLDLANFLSKGTNANAQNVASADEYAKYKALNNLGGLTGQLLTDESLAGTYTGFDADEGGIAQYLGDTEKDFVAQQQEISAEQETLNNELRDLENQLKTTEGWTSASAGANADNSISFGSSGAGPSFGLGTTPGGESNFGDSFGGAPARNPLPDQSQETFNQYKAAEIARLKAEIDAKNRAKGSSIKRWQDINNLFNTSKVVK